MLRRVFVIAMLAACHPAPAPTVVRAAPVATVPATRSAPVRQDYEVTTDFAGPLHEVLATGHRCDERRPNSPIVFITATDASCPPTPAGRRVEMQAPPR
ncbi:MAG TPA: hypothetical protein VFQ65_15355 [Kofleriaceae bacterium]|nr:hypothetical protein [Kofleriaceae bacterium]